MPIISSFLKKNFESKENFLIEIPKSLASSKRIIHNILPWRFSIRKISLKFHWVNVLQIKSGTTYRHLWIRPKLLQQFPNWILRNDIKNINGGYKLVKNSFHGYILQRKIILISVKLLELWSLFQGENTKRKVKLYYMLLEHSRERCLTHGTQL